MPSVVASPTIDDLSRTIEIEASKDAPDYSLIRELVDASKVVMKQGGTPDLSKPTHQDLVRQELQAEPKWKQGLIGASTSVPRAAMGIKGLFSDEGLYSDNKQQDVAELNAVRSATPSAGLGAIGGDVAAFAGVPIKGLQYIPKLGKASILATRPGQIVNAGLTSAGVNAATSPENRGMAALLGLGGGALGTGLAATTQRALPAGMGGVSRPQVAGEQLLRDLGDEGKGLIEALRKEYVGPPGVRGSSSVVSGNPLVRDLETGSRVGNSHLWTEFDQGNADARFNSLIGAAGTKAERDALVETRSIATNKSRTDAFDDARVTQSMSRAPVLEPVFKTLQTLQKGEQRENPAVQKIVGYVQKALDNTEGITPEQIYTVRKVLTGQLKTGANDEIGAAAAAARRETMSIVDEIDKSLNYLSGGMWGDYLKSYGSYSKDLNSMSALQGVIDKLTKGYPDGITPASMVGKTGVLPFGRATDDLTFEQFGSKSIDQLTPQSRKLVEALKEDLFKTNQGMNATSTGGSQTASFQAARGRSGQLADAIARQVGGAAGGAVGGLPGAVGGAAMSNAITSSLASSGKEGAEILARMLQDPRYMSALLEKANTSQMQLNMAKRIAAGASAAAAGKQQ